MSLFDLIVTAIALSMDAFAVAVCKGLAMKKCGAKGMCIVGAWFGAFQMLMPLLGYLLAVRLHIVFADRLKYTRMPFFLRGLPIRLIGAGLISMALFGLLGHSLAA